MKVGIRTGITLGALLIALAHLQTAARAQERGSENETGPYEVVKGWPKPLGHPGWTWGSQRGVFAEIPNRIILLQRGELPVPEKAPEGYTGGYGAFGIAATHLKMNGNCATFKSCWRAWSSSGTPLVQALMGAPFSGTMTLQVVSDIASSLLPDQSILQVAADPETGRPLFPGPHSDNPCFSGLGNLNAVDDIEGLE